MGLLSDHIEHLNYRITFPDKYSREVEGAKRFWIGGHCMQILVAHSNKRVKYIFDETIHHKETWCERMMTTQQLSHIVTV